MSTRKRGLDSNSASPKISQYFTPMDSETDMELTANETQNEGEIGDESCGQAYDELSQSSPEAPGADSTDHTEKKRKTNGNNHDKASTDRDLLLTLINKIDEMNTNLTSRPDTALNKIEMNRKDIENVKDKQEASQFDIDTLKDRVEAQEKENGKLRERLVDLTAREMRNTVIFHGFPEEAEERDCEKLIRSFAESHLQLERDDLKIERAHRSGPKTPSGPPRPIIVAFNRYTTRQGVLSGARRYLKDRPYNHGGKDHRIYVDEMLPKEIRDQRKKLQHIRKRLREEVKERKVYFKYPARLFYRDNKSSKEVEYRADKQK